MTELKSGLKVLLLLILNIPLLTSARCGLNHKENFNQIHKKYPCRIDSIPFQNIPLLNFSSYSILLGQDLKQSFTKPFHLNQKDWINLGKYAAVIFTLSFADEPIQQSALRLKNMNTVVNNISKGLSDFGGIYEVLTVAGIGAYGLISKNNKLANTALLSSQAYITSGLITTVLKFLSGRTRPSYYPAGVEAEPKFLGPFYAILYDGNGTYETSSFPSGHATVAFAVATVFATEYKDRPVVQVVAYSLASLISISRITENKHWVTDVVTGAAIGYLSGKLVVKNYHLFQKNSSYERKKNSIFFTLNYSFGQLEPGLIYKFY